MLVAFLAVISFISAAHASSLTCAVLTFDAKGGVSKDESSLLTDRFEVELDMTGVYTLTPTEKMVEVLK